MEAKKRNGVAKRYKPLPANFIKVDIEIKEEPNVTFWVGLLTMLPFPIVLIKMFSPLAVNLINQYTDFKITQRDLLDLLNSLSGVNVDVETEDANIKVKVF